MKRKAPLTGVGGASNVRVKGLRGGSGTGRRMRLGGLCSFLLELLLALLDFLTETMSLCFECVGLCLERGDVAFGVDGLLFQPVQVVVPEVVVGLAQVLNPLLCFCLEHLVFGAICAGVGGKIGEVELGGAIELEVSPVWIDAAADVLLADVVH